MIKEYKGIEMYNDNILVTVEIKEKSAGGIIIPGGSLDDTIAIGTVRADGRANDKVFTQSQTVLFNRTKSIKATINSEDYYIVKPEDILAILYK